MLPKELNFESMAQAFMNLVGERYPTSEKVLSLAKNLGVENNIRGQIIVFSQFRDAVREVSRDQIYRSVQHRDEVLAAIIEALEDLEDQLEEQETTEEIEDYEEEETVS